MTLVAINDPAEVITLDQLPVEIHARALKVDGSERAQWRIEEADLDRFVRELENRPPTGADEYS